MLSSYVQYLTVLYLHNSWHRVLIKKDQSFPAHFKKLLSFDTRLAEMMANCEKNHKAVCPVSGTASRSTIVRRLQTSGSNSCASPAPSLPSGTDVQHSRIHYEPATCIERQLEDMPHTAQTQLNCPVARATDRLRLPMSTNSYQIPKSGLECTVAGGYDLAADFGRSVPWESRTDGWGCLNSSSDPSSVAALSGGSDGNHTYGVSDVATNHHSMEIAGCRSIAMEYHDRQLLLDGQDVAPSKRIRTATGFSKVSPPLMPI